MPKIYRGGCNCGAVVLALTDEPVRLGLCHCMTCRKETGSAFMAFGVWDKAHVQVAGATRSWIGTTDRRHFCKICGSRLFATHDDDEEVEVRLGCLDEAPFSLRPEYEVWVKRREPWLPPVAGAVDHPEGR